ncbi:hypothetical protein LB505_011478 [Fusarium chuoi]|nr:hypothetical protein LB505_011478 [Fusarium chuoi]
MDLEPDLPALVSLDPSSQPLDYRQAMNWLCHLSFRHLPRLPQTEPLPIFRICSDLPRSKSYKSIIA